TLSSRASGWSLSSGISRASVKTASWFPVSGVSVKTSATTYRKVAMLSVNHRHQPRREHANAPLRPESIARHLARRIVRGPRRHELCRDQLASKEQRRHETAQDRRG